MKPMSQFAGLILLLCCGCGYRFGYRHLAGPILPAPEQVGQLQVADDQSIIFLMDRLEVILRPVTIEMLNRQFPVQSTSPKGFYQNPSFSLSNPYTYGDWSPPGQKQTPNRFTVFGLKVKNYAFPKVRIDPTKIHLTATNGRNYPALSLFAMVEYYWPYAVAYTGNTYRYFQERRDLLRKTLFKEDFIFSGQEQEGFIVFPFIDYDVDEFTVWIEDLALRFDYRDEPIESIDIPYHFHRDVYIGREARVEGQ